VHYMDAAPNIRTNKVHVKNPGHAPASYRAGLDNSAHPRYLAPMIDSKLLDDLAKRVAGSVPTGLQLLQEDLQKNLRSALEAGLSHLELVTREEFEIQRAVLLRTREKLEALEQRLTELEAGSKPSAD